MLRVMSVRPAIDFRGEAPIAGRGGHIGQNGQRAATLNNCALLPSHRGAVLERLDGGLHSPRRRCRMPRARRNWASPPRWSCSATKRSIASSWCSTSSTSTAPAPPPTGHRPGQRRARSRARRTSSKASLAAASATSNLVELQCAISQHVQSGGQTLEVMSLARHGDICAQIIQCVLGPALHPVEVSRTRQRLELPVRIHLRGAAGGATSVLPGAELDAFGRPATADRKRLAPARQHARTPPWLPACAERLCCQSPASCQRWPADQ